MISTVILTKNNKDIIKRCIDSLLWSDEIIAIDDYSTDGTLDKIRFYERNGKNIRIFQRNLGDDFASQRNFGLDKAKGDWILFIDSDEVVGDDLQREISKSIKDDTAYQGFYLKRRYFFMGKNLKYGETSNIKLLRLAKKNTGRWRRKVHEVWDIKDRIGLLEKPIDHYTHPTISGFLDDINYYSDLHAQVFLEEGKKTSVFYIIGKPLAKFIKNYLILLGFLDGIPGLIIALMMSFHSFLSQVKLWQLQQKISS